MGSNPFGGTADQLTWHYPNGWSFEIIPEAHLGVFSSGDKLGITTFRYTHRWQKTL